MIRQAREEDRAISVSGSRHAMGGQQFGAGEVLVDMRGMRRILECDPVAGQVEVEAGIQWPELIAALLDVQCGRWPQWGIIQKQTGADQLSLGGALAANVHGRGLGMAPIVRDLEAFTLMDASGRLIRCSRQEHPALFRLAIGGYGLFGIITSVRLRLARRRKLERLVQLIEVDGLMDAFERRMREGCRYGDFQFAIDPGSDGFLQRGIFSCYRPVEDDRPAPSLQRALSRAQWQQLVYHAHVDPRRAFEDYAAHYLATSGQLYWSDLHQLSPYVARYHEEVDRRLGMTLKATEVITELYVPRPSLTAFLAEAREDFRAHDVPLIYGTIRLIERDDETFLAWAKEPSACVIFNLHTVHTRQALERTADHFRRLIDLAIGHGGSFYLTYHRFATRAQIERCYPQFPAFLHLKRAHDPEERFQSDWYRHAKAMFSGTGASQCSKIPKERLAP